MAADSRAAKELQDTLDELVSEKGIPKNQIAAEIGITPSALSAYLSAKKEAGINTLLKIADYFQVSTDWLLGLTNDRNREAVAVDELGLSEAAIDCIRGMRDDLWHPASLYMLNALLNHEKFPALLNEIGGVQYAANGSPAPWGREKAADMVAWAATQKTELMLTAPGTFDIICGDGVEAFHLYTAQRVLTEIIDSVKKTPPDWLVPPTTSGPAKKKHTPKPRKEAANDGNP